MSKGITKQEEPLEACPTAEELAAFLEGALSPEATERVQRHIASCPDCYELYVDALHFELEAKKVLPFLRPGKSDPSHRLPLRWLGAAAGLIIAAASAYLLWPTPAVKRPTISPSSLAQSGALPYEAAASLKPDTMRGGPGEDLGNLSELDLARKFSIGVLLIDLDIATKRADRTTPLAFAQQLAAVSSSVHSMQGQSKSLSELYELLSKDAEAPLDPRDFLELQTRAVALLEAPGRGRAYQDYGQWSEAGRLAASSKYRAYFETEQTRAFLQWLLYLRAKDKESILIAAEERALLRRIQQSWPGQGSGVPDYAFLRGAFAEIQARHAVATE